VADTVRFFTVNDTATPANSSGGKGFTTPYVTGQTPGSDTDWPMTTTFQECIKMWWRVKNWTFSSTWAISNGVNTGNLPSGTMTASTPPNTELDLADPTITERNFSLIGTAPASANQVYFNLNNSFINDGTNVYPKLSVGFKPYSTGPFTVLQIGNDGNPAGAPVSFSFQSSDFSPATGSFMATVDGIFVEMFYDAFGTPGVDYTIGNMIFTPVEYWPYAADDDGSPVYNTTTGAQLQSPLN
jgi:hypothetical protein